MEELPISTVLNSLKRDPTGKGFSALCRDGAWRNFDRNRQVVDARGLSPAQIKDWLDRGPFDKSTETTFRGVDGRIVSQHDLFQPDESVLPKEKSAEQISKTRELIEKQQKEFRETQKSGIIDDKAFCVRKQSDYNLDAM
jgi:hypothetical protein